MSEREACCLHFASDVLDIVASRSFVLAALLDARDMLNSACKSKEGSAVENKQGNPVEPTQTPERPRNTQDIEVNAKRRNSSNKTSRKGARRGLRLAGHKLLFFGSWAKQHFETDPSALCMLLEEVKTSLVRWQQRQAQLKTAARTAIIEEVVTRGPVTRRVGTATDFDELE
jgi:hypothetical protein